MTQGQERRAINPAGMLDGPTYQMSQAVRVGNTIYCSGQVGFGGKTVEEQAELAFRDLVTVLGEAGATLKDIVKMTIYSPDEQCFMKIADVRRRHLSAPFPACTMIHVKSLAAPDLLIEIDVTAVVG